MFNSSAPPEWLPTGRAAKATGLSRSTLHRWREAGWLEEGRHYRLGMTPKSPIRWNAIAIEERISQLRNLPERMPAAEHYSKETTALHELNS